MRPVAIGIPALSIAHMIRGGVFGSGRRPAGWLFEWPRGTAGPRQVACMVLNDGLGHAQSMLLKYRAPGVRNMLFYEVGICSEKAGARGHQYRFQCPAVVNGRPCLRAAEELVLLRGPKPVFACSRCSDEVARHGRWGEAGSAGRYALQPTVEVATPCLPTVRCTTCSRQVNPANFCSSCGTLLGKPAERDPYRVLDVSRSALTEKALRAAYRRKLMEYHPDRLCFAGAKVRALAQSETAAINDAYRVLSNLLL